jgi:uncharacterized protein DUF5658
MSRLLLVVSAFVFAFPAPCAAADEHVPERGAALPALYAGLAGLNAFDVYSTSRGLALGAREANPLMRPVAGNPTALAIVKGSATAASIGIAERLWRQGRRRAAVTTMLISTGVSAAVAARNARTISR